MLLDPPSHCDDPELYAEDLDGDRNLKGSFRQLRRRSSILNPPPRAEQGDVAGRLLASEIKALQPPPQYGVRDPEACVAIRSECADIIANLRSALGGPLPDSTRMGVQTLQGVSCELVDQQIDRCLEAIPETKARHEMARARHEKHLSCVGVAIASRAADGESIELEVISATGGSQWGTKYVEVEKRVNASAWAYAPLTVVADIPLMTFAAVVYTPFVLIGALY